MERTLEDMERELAVATELVEAYKKDQEELSNRLREINVMVSKLTLEIANTKSPFKMGERHILKLNNGDVMNTEVAYVSHNTDQSFRISFHPLTKKGELMKNRYPVSVTLDTREGVLHSTNNIVKEIV